MPKRKLNRHEFNEEAQPTSKRHSPSSPIEYGSPSGWSSPGQLHEFLSKELGPDYMREYNSQICDTTVINYFPRYVSNEKSAGYVSRIPRTPAAAENLSREPVILESMKFHFPLRVQKSRHRVRLPLVIGIDAGYAPSPPLTSLLPGTSAATLLTRLEHSGRVSLVRSLARTLRALHSIPVPTTAVTPLFSHVHRQKPSVPTPNPSRTISTVAPEHDSATRRSPTHDWLFNVVNKGLYNRVLSVSDSVLRDRGRFGQVERLKAFKARASLKTLSNHIEKHDFDAFWSGRNGALSLVHGTYTLCNVLAARSETSDVSITGLTHWGNCGIGDGRFDVWTCVRSIKETAETCGLDGNDCEKMIRSFLSEYNAVPVRDLRLIRRNRLVVWEALAFVCDYVLEQNGPLLGVDQYIGSVGLDQENANTLLESDQDAEVQQTSPAAPPSSEDDHDIPPASVGEASITFVESVENTEDTSADRMKGVSPLRDFYEAAEAMTCEGRSTQPAEESRVLTDFDVSHQYELLPVGEEQLTTNAGSSYMDSKALEKDEKMADDMSDREIGSPMPTEDPHPTDDALDRRHSHTSSPSFSSMPGAPEGGLVPSHTNLFTDDIELVTTNQQINVLKNSADTTSVVSTLEIVRTPEHDSDTPYVPVEKESSSKIENDELRVRLVADHQDVLPTIEDNDDLAQGITHQAISTSSQPGLQTLGQPFDGREYDAQPLENMSVTTDAVTRRTDSSVTENSQYLESESHQKANAEDKSSSSELETSGDESDGPNLFHFPPKHVWEERTLKPKLSEARKEYSEAAIREANNGYVRNGYKARTDLWNPNNCADPRHIQRPRSPSPEEVMFRCFVGKRPVWHMVSKPLRRLITIYRIPNRKITPFFSEAGKFLGISTYDRFTDYFGPPLKARHIPGCKDPTVFRLVHEQFDQRTCNECKVLKPSSSKPKVPKRASSARL